VTTCHYNFVKKSTFLAERWAALQSQAADFCKINDEAASKLSEIQESYVFCGYPAGNFLKQLCIVMEIWHQKARFPIKFLEVDSLMDHDNTYHYLQSLDKLTPIIHDIFSEISGTNESKKSPRALQKDICEFLCLLEPRGFLSCLGIRKTLGS
jgi:hypothetical protein